MNRQFDLEKVPDSASIERIWLNTSKSIVKHRRNVRAWAGALIVGLFLAGTGTAAYAASGAFTHLTTAGTASFKVIKPTATTILSDANATLVPMHNASGLVTPAAAEKAIASALKYDTSSLNPSGPTTVALYAYSNSASGTIQADGTVKLNYVNTPVWEFSVPLSRFVDLSQGPAGGTGSSKVTRTDCIYYYLVNAADGRGITSGQECAVQDPNIPAPDSSKAAPTG
jgi:hypothetical protein